MTHSFAGVKFMKRFQWKTCIKWVVLTECVGILAGLLTRNGVEQYQQFAQKSMLTPPGWVFPVVWAILYALMGVGACIASGSKIQGSERCVNLFIVQLTVNFFWPLLFFNAGAYGFALLWLIFLLILVVMMSVCFYKKLRTAGLLQIPYILWLLFASYLNAAAWQLN